MLNAAVATFLLGQNLNVLLDLGTASARLSETFAVLTRNTALQSANTDTAEKAVGTLDARAAN